MASWLGVACHTLCGHQTVSSNDFTEETANWQLHPVRALSGKDAIEWPKVSIGVDCSDKGDRFLPLFSVCSTTIEGCEEVCVYTCTISLLHSSPVFIWDSSDMEGMEVKIWFELLMSFSAKLKRVLVGEGCWEPWSNVETIPLSQRLEHMLWLLIDGHVLEETGTD